MKKPELKTLPGPGFNPAARGGNASGPHVPDKGRGSRYNRAKAKRTGGAEEGRDKEWQSNR